MYTLTGFILDDIHSSEKGIIACRVNENSLIKFPFGVKRSIVEEKVNNKIYHYGMDKQPLEFSITLSLTEEFKFNYDKRYELVQWLFQDDEKYRKLVFDDNDFICYYVIAIDESERYDNSFEQGYINIKFRCNSPHAWLLPIEMEDNFADIIKPIKTLGLSSTTALTVGRNSVAPNPLQLYNPTSLSTYSSNTLVTVGTTPVTTVKDDYNDGTVIITQNGTTTFKYIYSQEIIQAPHSFVLENKSNIEKYIYPEIQISFVNNTSITLKNYNDGGKEFTFTGIPIGTVLFIDCNKHEIISSDNQFYLGNFNKNWFRLAYGKNQIKVNDDFKGDIAFKINTPVAI